MMAPVDAGTAALDASSEGDAAKPSTPRDGGSSVPGPTDPLSEDAACAASSVSAEEVVVEEQVEVQVEVKVPAPVALYVMFDRSLSMAASLWTPAVAALTDFIRDPDSAGMDMAINYFPSNGGACDGSGYRNPAVALGRLPGHANALVSSVGAQTPNGWGTPVEGALRGGTEYCKTFQKAHPDERCVVVLVTDGKPEFDNCEKNSDKLATIAADAWTKHEVRTFAVGLQGADFALLDKIAMVGGASDCDTGAARFSCDVSSGPDKLTAALAKIRETVTTVETRTETQTRTESRPLECEWQMPAPQAGTELDLDRVNVTLSGGSAAERTLNRVPGPDACRADAWHYDVPGAPTRIVACPQTCEAIKAGEFADVKILLGCQTQVLYL